MTAQSGDGHALLDICCFSFSYSSLDVSRVRHRSLSGLTSEVDRVKVGITTAAESDGDLCPPNTTGQSPSPNKDLLIVKYNLDYDAPAYIDYDMILQSTPEERPPLYDDDDYRGNREGKTDWQNFKMCVECKHQCYLF